MKNEKYASLFTYFIGYGLSLIALSLIAELVKKGNIGFFNLLSVLLILTVGLSIVKAEYNRSRYNSGK